MDSQNSRPQRSRPFTSDRRQSGARPAFRRPAPRSTGADSSDNIIVTGSDTDERGPRRAYAGSNPRRSFGGDRGQGSVRSSYTPRDSRGGSSFGSRSSSSSFGGGRGGSRGGFGGGAGGGRGRGRVMQTFDVSRYINLNPVTVDTEPAYEAKHTFHDFGLDKYLVEAIDSMNLVTPSPIQDQIIPHILEGRDVVGLAATGTGKTAAFLIPTINKTLKERNRLTLILAPTRELAIQVEQELRKLTPKMGIFSTVCVGGMNIRPQIMGLKKRNHFIIGTPGRVQDLIDRGHIKPAAFTTVILDEADRMLDMGFIHDMREILKDVPDDHETLFFSATMSKSVEGLIKDFMRDPITVSVKKKDITGSITQDVVFYEAHHKFDLLVDLLKKPEFDRVIIFGAMKHSVEKLSQELVRVGLKADAIHGNKSHGQRQRSLQNFKGGRVNILVATDVAARGIHVDNVSHVINYDLPNTFEDYVHRIGRTGRADKRGAALTFVPKQH
jgi:ATP-dependent RNA helicase RhlE